MNSKVKILVVLLIVVSLGLVIAACGGAPGITAEDLTGVWKQDKPGGAYAYLQLNEDGTYRFATSVPWLEESPGEIGQFRLEGTLFTFIPSNESRWCTGLSGSYEVELTEEGQLQFVLQEDPCQMRGLDQPGSWDRVSP